MLSCQVLLKFFKSRYSDHATTSVVHWHLRSDLVPVWNVKENQDCTPTTWPVIMSQAIFFKPYSMSFTGTYSLLRANYCAILVKLNSKEKEYENQKLAPHRKRHKSQQLCPQFTLSSQTGSRLIKYYKSPAPIFTMSALELYTSKKYFYAYRTRWIWAPAEQRLFTNFVSSFRFILNVSYFKKHWLKQYLSSQSAWLICNS